MFEHQFPKKKCHLLVFFPVYPTPFSDTHGSSPNPSPPIVLLITREAALTAILGPFAIVAVRSGAPAARGDC
jgi:hypothetical protein